MGEKEKQCKGWGLSAINNINTSVWGLPGASDCKESASNARNPGSISGLGRSPGEGNGNPLHYSCLENPIDRRTWQATVGVVTKSWTRPND